MSAPRRFVIGAACGLVCGQLFSPVIAIAAAIAISTILIAFFHPDHPEDPDDR